MLLSADKNGKTNQKHAVTWSDIPIDIGKGKESVMFSVLILAQVIAFCKIHFVFSSQFTHSLPCNLIPNLSYYFLYSIFLFNVYTHSSLVPLPSVEFRSPYILAILPKCIEIWSQEPKQFIQKISLPSAKLRAIVQHQSVYVSSQNNVWRLVPVPLHVQIKQLTEDKQFEMALTLVVS